MELLLVGIKNCGDLVQKEIDFLRKEGFIEKKYFIKENNSSVFSLKVDNLREAILFAYSLKTVGRVSIFLFSTNIEELVENKLKEQIVLIEDLLKELKELPSSSFSVRFTNKSSLQLNKLLMEREIGNLLKESNLLNFEWKVDLENPDILFRVIIDENKKVFFTLDLIGEKDLSKRGYKIYNHPLSLNSVLAQNLIYFSGCNCEYSMLDPMSGSGTICIEYVWKELGIPAAFLRDDLQLFKIKDSEKVVEEVNKKINWDKEVMVYCSDKTMRNVEFSRKNARIAKVEDKIKFSRLSIDWLDWKFNEGEIDFILTHPSFDLKLMEELFYQAEFMANNVVLASSFNIGDLVKIAEKYRYFLVNKKELERKDNLYFSHFSFRK